MRMRSLGSVITAASRGVEITGATNATPIVITIGGGSASNGLHGQRSGERVAIFGVTGNTAANGIWTLKDMEYSGHTAKLIGSAGNGSPTMTKAVITVAMDQTPFMKGHSAVALILGRSGSAAFDGVCTVRGNKTDATDDEILASDEDDLGTYFESCIKGQTIPTPGTTDGLYEVREVDLRRFMFFDVGTFTAGGVSAALLV